MTIFASRPARRVAIRCGPALCLALPAAFALAGCNADRLGNDHIPGADAALRSQAAQANATASAAAGAPADTSSAAKSGAVDATDLGLSLYPNAKPAQGSSGSMSAVRDYGSALTELVTSDPPAKVAAYYKKLYPAYTPTDPKDAKGEVSWKEETEDGKPLVRASLADPNGGNGVRMVRIYTEEGKTHIDICRITEDPALNFHDSLPKESVPATPPADKSGKNAAPVANGLPAKPANDPFAPSAGNPFSLKLPVGGTAASKPGKPSPLKDNLMDETVPAGR